MILIAKNKISLFRPFCNAVGVHHDDALHAIYIVYNLKKILGYRHTVSSVSFLLYGVYTVFCVTWQWGTELGEERTLELIPSHRL